MGYMGEEYFTLKPMIIKYERHLLKELGFCVHVNHPHKLIITYLQILEMEKNNELAQKAWNYMNDSLRSNVFVMYTPETIACACIFLAARQLKIPLPDKPSWLLLFDLEMKQLEEISRIILALYSHKNRTLEELERDVAVLKIQRSTVKQIEVKEVNLKKNTKEDSSRDSSPAASQHKKPLPINAGTDKNPSSVDSSSIDTSIGQSSSQSQDTTVTNIVVTASSTLSPSSSPIQNGNTKQQKKLKKRSLSSSPLHNRLSSRHALSSHQTCVMESISDRSRSRSPHRKYSSSPKPIISPIRFNSSPESQSEGSNSHSASPPPPLTENGYLPRQYRDDYKEHKSSRHKHRSHRGERRERERGSTRHSSRDVTEKWSTKIISKEHHHRRRHHRERERDHYDYEHERSHYSSGMSQRDREYLRKSDSSRYR